MKGCLYRETHLLDIFTRNTCFAYLRSELLFVLFNVRNIKVKLYHTYCNVIRYSILSCIVPGWLNELGSWIT